MLSEQKMQQLWERTQVPRPPYIERAESEIQYWKQFTIPECPKQLAARGLCQNGDLKAVGSKVTVSIKLPEKQSFQPMQGKRIEVTFFSSNLASIFEAKTPS